MFEIVLVLLLLLLQVTYIRKFISLENVCGSVCWAAGRLVEGLLSFLLFALLTAPSDCLELPFLPCFL